MKRSLPHFLSSQTPSGGKIIEAMILRMSLRQYVLSVSLYLKCAKKWCEFCPDSRTELCMALSSGGAFLVQSSRNSSEDIRDRSWSEQTSEHTLL